MVKACSCWLRFPCYMGHLMVMHQSTILAAANPNTGGPNVIWEFVWEKKSLHHLTWQWNNEWSKCKIYRNGLQEGDLKVSLCGSSGIRCKCVCFFVWNLKLPILSSSEGWSSNSVLPCLLLLHCQVRWCKSTQIALKLRKNKDKDSR